MHIVEIFLTVGAGIYFCERFSGNSDAKKICIYFDQLNGLVCFANTFLHLLPFCAGSVFSFPHKQLAHFLRLS